MSNGGGQENTGQVDTAKYSRIGVTETFLKYIGAPLGFAVGGYLFKEAGGEHLGPVTGTILSSTLLLISGALIGQRSAIKTGLGMAVLPFVAGISSPEPNSTSFLFQAGSYLSGALLSLFTNLISPYKKGEYHE